MSNSLDGNTPPAKPKLLKRLMSSLNGSGQAEAELTSRSTELGVNQAASSPADMRLRLAKFESSRVEDVMIPRADIVAVDEACELEALMQLLAEATHSRLPVFRDTLDDPVGLVHIKDVVTLLASNGVDTADGASQPLSKLKRDILYVPPSMRLPDLLVKMQTTRIHLALVVDEYGGTDGLVSLEDLVEEIVGDIEDEHDDEESDIVDRGRGIWEVDARTEIEDFMNVASIDLSLKDFEDDIDTLGGIAFAIAGRVPERGEIISHPEGVDMEILDGDTRRIKRLRLRCPSKDGEKSILNASTPEET